ncbi:hypothetical protein NUBL17186_18670 [Klebsiella quasipneumoniae]|nr:hypothetical protein NUBL17186_18670 [Klebsiella quasipneumoniae]
MPRQYEIEGAFRAAVKIEQTGRLTVTTKDFVKQLDRVLRNNLQGYLFRWRGSAHLYVVQS